MRYMRMWMVIVPCLLAVNWMAKAGTAQILVDSQVPIASALRELSELLGVLIAYEGPPYVSDTVIYRHNPDVEFYFPIGGSISFSYKAALAPLEIIEQLLKEYNESADEAHFSLVMVEDVFVVYPTAYRNEEGVMQAYQSPLDVELALNFQASTISQAMQGVLESVNAQSGVVPIALEDVHVPPQLLHATFSGNFSGQSAREALVQILATLNVEISSHGASSPIGYTWELRTGVRRGVLSDFPAVLLLSGRDFGDSDSNRIAIERERPIPGALKLLGDTYNFNWGYEDPMFLCPCDALHGTPTGQPLRFQFPRDASGEQLLEAMLRAYDAQVFDMTKDSGRYRIYPVAARNADGRMVSVKALSETPIPPDAATGKSNLDALSALQVEVEAQRGKGFSVSDPVLRHAASATLKSATSETRKAGVWFDEIASGEDEAKNWLLLYDPAKGTYELQFDDEAPEYP